MRAAHTAADLSVHSFGMLGGGNCMDCPTPMRNRVTMQLWVRQMKALVLGVPTLSLFLDGHGHDSEVTLKVELGSLSIWVAIAKARVVTVT